ncbi:MAG: hypothetical protein BGO01_16860 [Armatimonadetes bacterium 55-13]|nr:MAG: hypothetical protein BGO01_16860 [Armatimonadetes bacterium 55-13]
MRVDVLVFEGCPNGDASWELVRRVAQEECPLAELRLVDVPDAESAERLRFLGSPSVQVDGEDIEASRLGDESFSYSCRVYRTEEGTSGAVPESLVREALRRRVAQP